MRIDYCKDAKTFGDVRESIVGHPEKEIGWEEINKESDVSFALCGHGKGTVELYVCDNNGWCDMNKESVMDSIEGISHAKGFAKLLKKQTVETIVEKAMAKLGKETAVVYMEGGL